MKKIYSGANLSKLHTELNNNGIYPFPVFGLENGDVEITFSDTTDMNLVQQIIDAHNPAPSQPQPTEIELLQQENRMLTNAVTELTILVSTILEGGAAV